LLRFGERERKGGKGKGWTSVGRGVGNGKGSADSALSGEWGMETA